MTAPEAIAPKPSAQGQRLISKATATYIFGVEPQESQLIDLNRCLTEFKIDTPQRMRHFMAQIAHESGGLKWLKELASGDDYEGRSDLGNNRPGDGRRFKGAGAIQLTGRSNYQSFANHIKDQRVMEGGDYVAVNYPFSSAGYWWYLNDMNKLCDRPDVNVLMVSRRVNCGSDKGDPNGLDDRIYYYERACNVI